LRPERRRPGVLAADLLPPRAARLHRLLLLRLGCVEGPPAPLEAARRRRPGELRRHPPGADRRLPRPRLGLALGEDLLGPLVALERGPARALPRPLPLLLRLLHAPLLGRAR